MYVLALNIEYEWNVSDNTFQMSFSASLELLHPSKQYLGNLILNITHKMQIAYLMIKN